MTDHYEPIDCGLYDRYEAWATRGVTEYLVLDDGEELRLDRIIAAEPT